MQVCAHTCTRMYTSCGTCPNLKAHMYVRRTQPNNAVDILVYHILCCARTRLVAHAHVSYVRLYTFAKEFRMSLLVMEKQNAQEPNVVKTFKNRQ